MADAAYNSTVKLTGTTTAFLTEAMTGAGAGPYTITDANKAIWNPGVALLFYDNAVLIPSTDILSVDYFFGKVTFTAAKVGPITVSGSYLPTHDLACGREFDIQFSADLLDVTCFATEGVMLRQQGLKDITGSIGFLDNVLTDLDPGLGTLKLYDVWNNGLPKVLEIRPGPSGNKIRMRVIFEDVNDKAAVDGLVEGTMAFQLAPTTSQEGFGVSYGEG
jgi:hypothetical protein